MSDNHTEPKLSHFHVYSIGIAAANKHLDTDILYVTPIEITPYIDGELDADIEEDSAGGEDKYQDEYTVKVKHDIAVEATWLRLHHTHRRTAPDVRRGERVMLYRHSDSERLYWDSMGMDDHLRKLETVIWTWSDTQDEKKDSTHPQNCYSLEICTHTKQITLRTMKANEEPFAYTFQFNTDYGAVTLKDDDGNFIELDSKETRIRLYNKMRSEVHLNQKVVYINGDLGVFINSLTGVYITSNVTSADYEPHQTTFKTPRFEGHKRTGNVTRKPPDGEGNR